MYRTALLSISLIFLLSCGYIPTTAPVLLRKENVFPKKISGSTFKLINWNIHKEGNKKSWIGDMKNESCTSNPDIVLFQEALLNSGLKYTLLAKKLDWIFVPNALKNNYFTGVLTASKLKPIITIPIISSATEPLIHTPKASLITSYQLSTNQNEEKLLIANVHGINFVKQIYFDAHMEQIYKEIEPYRNDHAIILAGDFNTWSEPRINKLKEIADKLELDKEEIPHVTTPPFYARLLPKIKNLPLDHVFYSSNKLIIEKSEALDCVSSSDHKPIYVEFSIKR